MRRSTGSSRLISSSIGRRSSHQVAPASISGPSRSRASAGSVGLGPPRTISNGRSGRRRAARGGRRPGRGPRRRAERGRASPYEQRDRAVPSGGTSHRCAMRPEAADPDRRPRPLHRRGQQGDVLEPGSADRRASPARRTSTGPAGPGPRPGARRAAGSVGSPKLPYSSSIGPPRPGAEDHPPAAQVSRVATWRASCCGRRRATGVTSGPSLIRDVASAAAVSSIQGSPKLPLRRLAVDDVVPEEQPVPARLLGRRRPPSRPSGHRRSPRSSGC